MPSVAASGASPAPLVPYLPSDIGFLQTTLDPAVLNNSATLTAGQILLAKIPIRQGITISNLYWAVNAAGTGGSTGSFTGLYSAAGVLLSQDAADIGAGLVGPGWAGPFPLGAPQAFPNALPESAWPWAALLTNFVTTQVSMSRANGAGGAGYPNGLLTAANLRFASAGAGLAALPASLTPSGFTAQFGLCCGIT